VRVPIGADRPVRHPACVNSRGYTKVHLVTEHYLKAWAVDGKVGRHNVQYGRRDPAAPGGVGYRRQWWGKGDPELNRMCEDACGRLETVVPPVLSGVVDLWPLSDEYRAILAEFIALHIVRTDGFRDWFTERRRVTAESRRGEISNVETYQRFLREVMSDRERSKRILSLLNKIATVVGSMHWTLLVFDEPVLITGDQPVTIVPYLDTNGWAAIKAFPETGIGDIIELRFPITPRAAVVASWFTGATLSPVPGRWPSAATLNHTLREQTQMEWFYSTSRAPAFPPLVEVDTKGYPISSQLIRGYDSAWARQSTLRLNAIREVHRLIDIDDDTTKTIVKAQPAAAPPTPRP